MIPSLEQIDALHAESSALVARANALRAASRTEPDLRRALALYGRAAELAGECQLHMLARLKSTTTPTALGARSWVDYVAALRISHDEARVRLKDVAALSP
ncbi:hypothetical protein ACWDUN_21325 [Mycobacterium sp. NPDC003323]